MNEKVDRPVIEPPERTIVQMIEPGSAHCLSEALIHGAWD
jgi:hypothetical protein